VGHKDRTNRLTPMMAENPTNPLKNAGALETLRCREIAGTEILNGFDNMRIVRVFTWPALTRGKRMMFMHDRPLVVDLAQANR
jgi:hypothetical protein